MQNLIRSDSLSKKSSLVVAVVEDDVLLRQEIVAHLKANQFETHDVSTAAALDDLTTSRPIDIYIIDLNLPGESGMSLCNRLRQRTPNVGIVIMTGRVALHDRLTGYSHGGADFYLTKPVSPEELTMVLQNLGRRVKNLTHEHDWQLSLRDRTLQPPGESTKIRLTAREKILLVALSQANDFTLESGAICDLFTSVNVDEGMSKHALEELIARFRKKMKSFHSPGSESAIKSVWGVGYQLCIPINLIY
jgi:DNA-binding response OmpR family regulator